MRVRRSWSPLIALASGSLAWACGDDDGSNGTVTPYDASVWDAAAPTATSAGDTIGLGSDVSSNDTGVIIISDVATDAGDAPTSSNPSADGTNATPSPLDAGAEFDGGDGTDGTWADTTSGPSVSDVSSTDAATIGDAGPSDLSTVDAQVSESQLPDAQVFVPDGGVVLRPAELEFDPAYLTQLSVPEGFQVDVFATPGGQTRMLEAYGGAVYVTRPEQGDVLRLEDTNADGVADVTLTAVSGYPTVHGIAFDGDDVYLATPRELIRGAVNQDGSFGALEVLIDDLPDGGQHPLRTLGVGPDGLLYLSIGSDCDACEETNPEHATLLQVAPDGASRTIYASGLRNTIGFGWHPDTEELWGVDNGSDWRGDDLPPEELNLIEQGNDYGWPYCYGKRAIDPIIANPPNTTKADYCAATTPSVLENQAHEAPIGLVFYDGLGFPEAYQGDAFVAMHGSWNRIPATGYKIVRVVFDNGEPTSIEDFVSGFLNAEGLATFGRPAGLTVDAAGALLFSDDSNGVVYRVTAAQ